MRSWTMVYGEFTVWSPRRRAESMVTRFLVLFLNPESSSRDPAGTLIRLRLSGIFIRNPQTETQLEP